MRAVIAISAPAWPAPHDRRGFILSAAYAVAVQRAGGLPVVLPALRHPLDLDGIDGLILSGGGDPHPDRFGQADAGTNWSEVDTVRDAAEFRWVAEARRRKMPVLGICRGMQVLAVALGGTLVQDLARVHPETVRRHRQTSPRNAIGHQVTVSPKSRLGAIVRATALGVNSFHHQAVERIPPGMVTSGLAEDGVLEAIEAEGEWFALGVQWHPEELIDRDPSAAALFAAFVGAAGRYAEMERKREDR